MDTVADDLREPDETRPAKRVRLEAPLDMTEEVEEEMIDDEDLYGAVADGEAESRAVIEEPDLKPPVHQDVAHELPNDVTLANGTGQAHIHGSATAEVDDAKDTEDLYGSGEAETADGLPAEAVDHGEDEFVAPPHREAGEDDVEAAMMEETSRVEAETPVKSGTASDGAQRASEDAVEQLKEVAASPPLINGSSMELGGEHIAPPRTRKEELHVPQGTVNSTAADQPSAAAGAKNGSSDEIDVLGDLESALRQGVAQDTSRNGEVKSAGTKPQDDPEFLEAAAAQKGKEVAEWQFDSSDAESSDDSSDSSDSDSDSESGSESGYEMLDPATAAKILMSGDGDDDDSKEKNHARGGPRTANEVKDEVVPKPEVQVTGDMKITLLGSVQRTVDNLVLIEGATPGEYQVLESGSVLCNDSREVIGAVFETFGQVQKPLYSVAFTNAQEISDMGLAFGTQVFYVDAHSTFVFTQPLKNMKGTDASNIHDEEVAEDDMEFSDDEKEAEYKRQKKAAKRGGRGGLTRSDFNSNRGGMRTFGAPGHDGGHTFVASGASDAPQTTYGGGMSYDDEDVEDDFYQPLKRPDNLSDMMSGAPPPPPQRGFDRGRGRGWGRGDRGRGDRGRGRGGFQQRGNYQGSPPEAGHRGAHTQGGQRGGSDQASAHRGNAHSFPDRHNNKHNKNKGRGQHNLPSKPHKPQSPTPPQSSPQQQQYEQYSPFPQPAAPLPAAHAPQTPQTYQFNGYTFQYNNTAPQQQYQQPAQQPQYYQQQAYLQHPPAQQQSPGAQQFPPGAYVNPAFWAAQQQQQQAQQYGGWRQQGRQQYAQPQAYAQGQPQGQGQPNNLADILRVLGGQGQGKR